MVHIGIGQAEHLRSRCHSLDLICPIGNCQSPALTTRAHYTTAVGTFVRDGYGHLAAPTPDHQPESLDHVQGKLLVADWLTRTGWTDVELERYDTQSGRTPDVTASSGECELWSERNSDLHASGFEVLWLWGHSRREVSKTTGTIAIWTAPARHTRMELSWTQSFEVGPTCGDARPLCILPSYTNGTRRRSPSNVDAKPDWHYGMRGHTQRHQFVGIPEQRGYPRDQQAERRNGEWSAPHERSGHNPDHRRAKAVRAGGSQPRHCLARAVRDHRGRQ